MLLNSYANLIWFVCVVLFLYWGWIGNLLIGFDLFLRYFRVKKPNSHFASYDPCSLKGMFFLHPLQIMFHGREGHFLKRRNISFYVKQQRKGWTTVFSILNVIDEYFLQFLWTECHHQKLDWANSFFLSKLKFKSKTTNYEIMRAKWRHDNSWNRFKTNRVQHVNPFLRSTFWVNIPRKNH